MVVVVEIRGRKCLKNALSHATSCIFCRDYERTGSIYGVIVNKAKRQGKTVINVVE